MGKESYWNNRRREAVEKARRTLERSFDIRPTLSERMFLKNYVLEQIEIVNELKRTMPNGLPFPYPQPIDEAVGKFLMIHYNFRDVIKIQRICMGYTSVAVSRQLIEKSRLNDQY
ncbi:MAG: hypothetical protein UR15_C0001G0032 [Parcubacteria group bacterium GW2011_GWA2_31_28]|nr:MAG: hypothetical protein UR15_C0001G0032 [Parcubacteria group bacterium GW2011_GWA2_31_28]